MRKSGLVLVLVSFCPLAFGQLDSNSITVSASNNASLQPDQAIFSVSVQSGMSTGFDDVLSALQGSGITAANLSNVSGGFQQYLNVGGMPSLTWTFRLLVPLTNTKTSIASLNTLQQNIAKLNNGLMLSFIIEGTQVSQQLAQSQTCSLSALVTAATTQAQSLAAAGGVTLGSITALSGSSSTGVSDPYATSLSCAITVKFSVTRY